MLLCFSPPGKITFSIHKDVQDPDIMGWLYKMQPSVFVFLFLFCFLRKSLSFFPSSFKQGQTKPPVICATHQANISYMMDASKRYEGTTKVNISRGMISEKYTSLNIIYVTKKNNNNKNRDYIANSQCCGLYSYGKLSKETK